ncbi:MAG: hypothetical protein HEP71_13250 [Roseivirga sp.]|nr:hypothetical protein [Roseivirga sp.]
MKKTLIALIFLSVQLSLTARQTNTNWSYPAPSGAYQVGTVAWTLEDCSRTEKLTPDKQCRKFTVRAWYPAASTTGRSKLGFLEGYDLEKTAPFFGLHGARQEELKARAQSVKTSAYKDADITKKKSLPVIIFSHGFGLSLSELHASFAIEAASQGYLVFGINHPYESMATHLNDQIVYLDAAHNQRLTNSVFANASKLVALPTLPDDLARKELMKEVLGSMTEMNTRLEEWVKDQRFLIDHLISADKDKSSKWHRKVDSKRIGTMGHSFGGTTAAQTLMDDAHVKSAVNLDGLQMGDLVNKNVDKPLMMVSSKIYQGLNDSVFEGATGPIFLIHPGDKMTYHNVYTDMVLWPDSYFDNRRQAIGEVDGATFVRMINKLLLTFFDHSLNKKEINLNRVLNDYDQLKLIEN